ncbi:kinase-like domain-containing protein [Bisporella sp. PMI_857]|nr:kinase-like domain-containing protein [Bisporella sp. PMI_857]
MIEREALILDFMKADGFLDKAPDSSLPYEEHDLKRIIPECYRQFYDTQWIFAAPIFSPYLHYRSLHDSTILPFIATETLADGGFGSVSLVTLARSHQNLSNDKTGTLQLIRKELKPKDTIDKDYKHEQHMLSLLRALRHPNIVHFYTAYTLRDKYSLLFAAAEYDLKTFLHSERDSSFSDSNLIHALSGLASAIQEVHGYFSSEHQYYLIGCHYDIHPGNVLVQGHLFILADFGLSRLKDKAQGSHSDFKGGLKDYLAPECQDWDTFVGNSIGRASDIWSFGCILAEVATYIAQGHLGVEDFEAKRKISDGYIKLSTFHDRGALNRHVTSWLNNLETSTLGKEYTKGLLYLVRNMLEIEPTSRPTAPRVASRIFFLAQQMKYSSCIGDLDKLPLLTDFGLKVERERLNIWAKEVGLTDTSEEGQASNWFCKESSKVNFDKVEYTLGKIMNDLSTQAVAYSQEDENFPNKLHHHTIQTCLDCLWEMQPQDAIQRMDANLESYILIEAEAQAELFTTGDLTNYPRPQLLVGMTRALIAVKNYGAQAGNFLVHQPTLMAPRDWNDRKLGYIDDAAHGPVYTLTEFLEYRDDWADNSEKLLERINGIVSVLNNPDMAETFPLLRCKNFYHIPPRNAFGLVYQIPTDMVSENNIVQPITLAELFDRTKERLKRPPLGEIFWLAHTLAISVLSFHKAQWLHKGISSYNLIFFPKDSAAPGDSISSIHIIGFNYSRGGDKDEFTIGPSDDRKLRDYQHPEYSSNGLKVRFEERFDYYSLGMVLLELGRWKRLSHMTRNKELRILSPVKLRDHLLGNEVSQLRSSMGIYYHNAVTACLDGFYERRLKENTQEVWAEFEEKVVQPLVKCLALQPSCDQASRVKPLR